MSTTASSENGPEKTIVELDETECAYAYYLMQQRADTFDHDDYEATTYNGDSKSVHLRGAKAEIAVAKHYGLNVDETVRTTGDSTDFKAKVNGVPGTIDVKSTTYKPPWLWVRSHKTNSDYYIATYLENDQASKVWVVGWATNDDVLKADYIQSPVKGERHMNYRLKEHELQDLPPVNEITTQQ